MAQDAAYRKAEWMIEAMRLVRSKRLDLSRMKLTELPDSLGKLTQLQTLYLPHNELTTLPESLGQLTQLRLLHVAENKLTTLPESLGQLTQLRVMFLYNNQLTTLPESLGTLTRLQSLHLDNNQLAAIPESLALGELSELTYLFLHGNPNLGLSPDILGPTWQEINTAGKQAADPRTILTFYFG